MKSVYPIKETVKVITITKPNQKINFQIRHPENMDAIIGIAVTSDKMPDAPAYGVGSIGNMVGQLSISIPQKGDIVFGDDVMLDNNDYSDLTEKIVYGLTYDISQSKKRGLYFETLYPVDKAMLEGYYEDVYAPSLFNSKGELLPYLYKIRIYIRYKVKQPIEKTPIK
jgi:hypothetical protein